SKRPRVAPCEMAGAVRKIAAESNRRHDGRGVVHGWRDRVADVRMYGRIVEPDGDALPEDIIEGRETITDSCGGRRSGGSSGAMRSCHAVELLSERGRIGHHFDVEAAALNERGHMRGANFVRGDGDSTSKHKNRRANCGRRIEDVLHDTRPGPSLSSNVIDAQWLTQSASAPAGASTMCTALISHMPFWCNLKRARPASSVRAVSFSDGWRRFIATTRAPVSGRFSKISRTGISWPALRAYGFRSATSSSVKPRARPPCALLG